MKKIMFNDRYGLTQAVLEGRKTQTRRLLPTDLHNASDLGVLKHHEYECVQNGDGEWVDIRKCGQYHTNEEVAVAQCYRDIINPEEVQAVVTELGASKNGINNKMFVRADLMPHRIKITNIRVEKLQDISNEDCLAEGVKEVCIAGGFVVYEIDNPDVLYYTPQQAYAALIDKVCGKGLWEKNPYVFVYDFKLIK